VNVKSSQATYLYCPTLYEAAILLKAILANYICPIPVFEAADK